MMGHLMKRKALILFVLFWSAQLWATALEQSSTVQNPSEQHQSNEFIATFYYTLKSFNKSGGANLLAFEKVDQNIPLPKENYNRKKHFAGWVDDSRDNSCLNTRGLILERSSEATVEYGGARGCTVISGKWYDPYTDTYFNDAIKDIQIDHLVPLKHAYQAGAFEWSKLKRCLYSNYLWNDFHLIPVQGRENSKKGDKSPVGYLPQNKKYICEYLKNWLKTKIIWNLRVTPLEKQAIESGIEKNNCKVSEFQISQAEIAVETKHIEDNMQLCTYNPYYN